MANNTKIKKNSLKKLQAQLKKAIRAKAKKVLPKILKRAIIDDHILKGKSPVRGVGKFEKYSIRYTRLLSSGKFAPKKSTPVNLRLSGDMLKSFEIKISDNGFSVNFDSELAFYHQFGLGHLPARPLLPVFDGTKYTQAITKEYDAALKKTVNSVSKNVKVK